MQGLGWARCIAFSVDRPVLPASRMPAAATPIRRFARARRSRFQNQARMPCSRATGITAYLEAGGTLENAQAMAAHESPRTTKLYDRTGDEIALDEVERITI